MFAARFLLCLITSKRVKINIFQHSFVIKKLKSVSDFCTLTPLFAGVQSLRIYFPESEPEDEARVMRGTTKVRHHNCQILRSHFSIFNRIHPLYANFQRFCHYRLCALTLCLVVIGLLLLVTVSRVSNSIPQNKSFMSWFTFLSRISSSFEGDKMKQPERILKLEETDANNSDDNDDRNATCHSKIVQVKNSSAGFILIG